MKPQTSRALTFTVLCIVASIGQAIAQNPTQTTVPTTFYDSLTPKLRYTIPVAATRFTTDRIKNCYVLTSANEWIKYDVNGKRAAAYSRTGGAASDMLDAQQPQTLMLYSPTFQNGVYLDAATFAATEEFTLNNTTNGTVLLAAVASDGSRWLYDGSAHALYKQNTNSTTTAEGYVEMATETAYSAGSSELMQRLPPDFVPTAMFETERFLVLHSPKQGIWLFDNLGSPLTQLPNNKNDPPAQNVQVYNSMLFFTRGTQLYRLRLDTPVLKGKQKDDLRDFTVVPVRLAPLVTPLDSTDVIRIENRTLFVARKDRIEVYRF